MYAELFGMSISDLQALMNLNQDSLNTIRESVLSHQAMIDETQRQLDLLPSRIHLSEQIQNIFDNTMLTSGMAVASNSAMYTTYLVADMLKKATGGIDVPIPIPMAGVMNINIADTLKTGILGAGLLGSMGSVLGSLFAPQSLKLSNFGGSTTVTRGGGYRAVDTGVSSGTSQSATIGGTAENIEQSSIAGAKENASKNRGEEPEYVKEIREALGSLDNKSTVLGLLKAMEGYLDTLAGSVDGGSMKVSLSNPITEGGF